MEKKPSLLFIVAELVVVEKLDDKVNVCDQHTTAAVSVNSKSSQSLTV